MKIVIRGPLGVHLFSFRIERSHPRERREERKAMIESILDLARVGLAQYLSITEKVSKLRSVPS